MHADARADKVATEKLIMNAVVESLPLGPAAAESLPRVVVVDDSRASLALYSRSVAGIDLDIMLFESPRRGFEYLQVHPADLIFLGNLMRETDGMTLLRRLRALPLHADTRVVIMSTKDYDQDRDMARALGASEYLVKPARSQEIRQVITKYTGAQINV
jgi:CheY-like chemotaxis protein